MNDIHPTAIVSSRAHLEQDVSVGPFVIIEADARIGTGCRLAARAVVKQGVVLGRNNVVSEGAVLGGDPQHLRAGEEQGGLTIGEGNTIRENATIHRALKQGELTSIGDGNLIMVCSHIAHDCRIGNHTVITNNALLAGHVAVEDRAYLSGGAAVHQFCRIGGYAMVGGQAHVTQDVPPYVTVDGKSSQIVGLNVIGLRRNGFSSEELQQLKAAYRVIYRSGMRWIEVLATLQEQFPEGPAARFHQFLTSGSRGFLQERRTPPAATLRVWRSDEAAASAAQRRAG